MQIQLNKITLMIEEVATKASEVAIFDFPPKLSCLKSSQVVITDTNLSIVMILSGQSEYNITV